MKNQVKIEVLSKNPLRMRYTVPVKGLRKWWQFWKDNTTNKQVEEFKKGLKRELINPITGEIYLPIRNN